MQLHLHTYGTYLHVKDAMFDIRKKQADGSWSSTGVAVHKVKSVWVSRGIAISSDAVSLAQELLKGERMGDNEDVEGLEIEVI